MSSDLEPRRRLEQGLLRLYKLALAERNSEVADHLLCALEQLAKTDPACKPTLDQAYLWGVCGPRGRCNA